MLIFDKEIFLEDFYLQDANVLAIIPYGSRVYGTATEQSDYDYTIVCKKVDAESDRLDSKNNPISITLFSKEGFQAQLDNNKIAALECFFCPIEKQIKNYSGFNFTLNKWKLRESVSEKSSKDWVQCKKRLGHSQEINPITGERYLRKVYEAKKSLFHCFRIIDFGIQIVQYGKIINFSSCNELWEELYTDPSEDWESYNEKYKARYNASISEFRKLAPNRLIK